MTCIPASPHDTPDIAQELSKAVSTAAAELKREIAKRAKPIALPPNCVVFREGDPPRHVYLLQKGEVRFTILTGKRTLPCFTVEGGAFLGLSAVIAGARFSLTATASPDAELLQMDAGEFIELIESRTQWYMSALRALAAETLQAHHALAEMIAS